MASWRRPLIVGAAGQVGAALAAALRALGAPETILRSSRRPTPGSLALDLADLAESPDLLKPVEDAAPDLVLCAGGMTFVDGCERAPNEAMRANALGPAVLAAFAHRRRAPFVFFSSDYVFSGSAATPGPYDESAPTHPLSVYGRSKLAGEQAVLSANPDALIVRTTVVYGADPAGKNFLYTLLRHLRTGQPLRVPRDQISTPTWNRDLAAAVLALLDAEARGIVHVAGPERLDRLQFAQVVAGFFGLDPALVAGLPTAALGQLAARPLLSGLATSRLETLVPNLQRHDLREALQAIEPEIRAFLRTLAEQPVHA